jgi:hypothetical protein
MQKKKNKQTLVYKTKQKMHVEEPMEISSLVRNYRNGNEVKNYMC